MVQLPSTRQLRCSNCTDGPFKLQAHAVGNVGTIRARLRVRGERVTGPGPREPAGRWRMANNDGRGAGPECGRRRRSFATELLPVARVIGCLRGRLLRPNAHRISVAALHFVCSSSVAFVRALSRLFWWPFELSSGRFWSCLLRFCEGGDAAVRLSLAMAPGIVSQCWCVRGRIRTLFLF